MLIGTPFGTGSIEILEGSQDDPSNITLLATVNELDGNKFEVTIEDGVGDILGFTMECLDLDTLYELLKLDRGGSDN